MEARLAAILADSTGKPRSFLTVAHSPLLDGLRGLERQGRVELSVTEVRPGRYRIIVWPTRTPQ